MFNSNSGYIGSSRSVRSKEAIMNFEVPCTLINGDLIRDFLEEYEENFSKEDLDILKKVIVAKWKYVATERVGASSWHHTSCYFNKTNHYSLSDIAEKIIEIKDTLDSDYQDYLGDKKREQEKQRINYRFGVIKVQVWGGTRKSPKIVGYQEVVGIISGEWLYYCDRGGTIAKYKTTANKVEWLKEYQLYRELTKNHKEYKNTKKVFNKIIKEKVK